jgi:hypothetical protein
MALSDYHLFVPLKGHLNGHHYETHEAVQEAVRSWNGLGPQMLLRVCNAGRKAYIEMEIL